MKNGQLEIEILGPEENTLLGSGEFCLIPVNIGFGQVHMHYNTLLITTAQDWLHFKWIINELSLSLTKKKVNQQCCALQSAITHFNFRIQLPL